ncbi:nuclear transport factor 2 family protein [Acuticoccus kandeliae]|uniref:nuclear transport factor 2 family protein n=1 Tax=Acuticoccus kandeliae TaxID=2073160 RepID=UPI000D3EAD67|nr:nuclear transport factor 2 family protein [Acuticoccus kandeliae]
MTIPTATPHEACAALFSRYALAQDTGDVDAFLALFTEDAAWHRPMNDAPLVGSAEIVPTARALFGGRGPDFVCQHFVSNVLVTFESAERGEGSCYALAFAATRGADGSAPPIPAIPAGILRYFATFARCDDGWKFAAFRAVRVFRPA